jgi:hypothetical protein
LRRFFVLFVLISLFVGLIWLRGVVLRWHYVVVGEPGDLLYAATFDDFTDEWEQYRGILESQISEGTLTLSTEEVNRSFYSLADSHFADFDLMIDARMTGGDAFNGYGVVFRLQDPDNYYQFLVSGDGYYALFRKVEGSQTTLHEWKESSAIEQGFDAHNRLRVIASGDKFRFYINDQPVDLCVPDFANGQTQSTYNAGGVCMGLTVDTLVDGSISSGQLGPSVYSFRDYPGVAAAFDNILVFAPEPIVGAGK